MNRMRVATGTFDVAVLRRELMHPACGGFCAFEGWVRDTNAGAPVDGLDYEAYAELTIAEGDRIIAEAVAAFDIVDARCVHRVGTLAIGDLAIWIGVAAPHRDAAFRACRYIIDEAKRRLPVWKKEHYLSGESSWVMPAVDDASMAEHSPVVDIPQVDRAREGLGEGHADAPAGHDGFKADHSRQMRLAGFGVEGQARLAASRVLVVGAGGLGVPALSYLAGAGVGTIGIVDGDRLEASNLHRQVMYSARDVGDWKVDLAARRLREIDPALDVEVFRGVLAADTIDEVFRRYDLVLECTDDIRSKYLCSDAAVRTGTPIVFASIYQYEGQLHAWDPDSSSPCLRCLWPTPPDPASLGTCEQAGVLGPVPGILGAMQAIEAIKRIVGLPATARDTLLLVNLLDYGIRAIAAGRTGPCLDAGHCVVPASGTAGVDALEIRLATHADIAASGLVVVDIRNADEVAASPMGIRSHWLPMSQLLASADAFPSQIPDTGHVPGYLIVCARGQRSAHVVAHLRERGATNTWSLAGGLASLT
jgi:molybdopterin/thiamine biosynthesis adenylyltransferase/molybdopterin synthase catalytic subunit/rhodanese-related sulfurtransferase